MEHIERRSEKHGVAGALLDIVEEHNVNVRLYMRFLGAQTTDGSIGQIALDMLWR
jgi:hypothetical protein